MTEHDDGPLIRAPMIKPPAAGGFGRRPGAMRRAAGPAGIPQQRREQPRPLVVRYNRGVALVGFSLLGIASHMMAGLRMTQACPAGQRIAGANGGSVMMVDAPQNDFLLTTIIAGLIGLAWIAQGLLRAKALTIDASGMRGFTLLGTRHFAWSDIARIETNWHGKYRRQLVIHATVGSETGGYGILSPTQIPIMTAKIDRSVDQIMAAVHQYRPDLALERNESPRMIAIVDFLTRYTKHWHS